MKKIQLTYMAMLLLLTGSVIAGINQGIAKMDPEMAGVVFDVRDINYKAKIIYVDDYELAYNANTKFITKEGLVKPTAVKPGSRVRFILSDKKLQSLRTVVSKVIIKAQH